MAKINTKMTHPERYEAKRVDTPNRSRDFTDRVYSGYQVDRDAYYKGTFETERSVYPAAPEYNIYFGEMHGHTRLSDGFPTTDEYYTNIRDNAKLDFAALSDHDHGGVAKPELYTGVWEEVKAAAKKYYEPGKFTTLLAYERDSYPWYNNSAVFFNSHDAEMFDVGVPGDMTKEQLKALLAREDCIFAPHDTAMLTPNTDLSSIPTELYTPLMEIYSRGDCAEYFDNPYNDHDVQIEGCFWQDALNRGAKMGVYAGSDDHCCKNGLLCEDYPGLQKFPGITGVWAKENTLEGIFEALKARRCYGFMGPERITIDFRINGHYMGEEITDDGDREVYFNITTEVPVKKVTLFKNQRDYIIFRRYTETFLYDYKQEKDTDVYYLRVELEDGRCAWTSPIWINK